MLQKSSQTTINHFLRTILPYVTHYLFLIFLKEENNEDYENVSYDFESFFINITAKATNYYILHENQITEPRMLNILD